MYIKIFTLKLAHAARSMIKAVSHSYQNAEKKKKTTILPKLTLLRNCSLAPLYCLVALCHQQFCTPWATSKWAACVQTGYDDADSSSITVAFLWYYGPCIMSMKSCILWIVCANAGMEWLMEPLWVEPAQLLSYPSAWSWNYNVFSSSLRYKISTKLLCLRGAYFCHIK